MQFFDLTWILIWWIVPLALLLGRAALAAYRTKKKKEELAELEKRSTPFSQDF
ncbi:MAG: hypothetical protein BAJATHORv1_40027 [Candidatus Thorarchaeota archaeon]|nr:MAG: hypothetical protein BAJATHORv1_40027 [Candidatus Thorarchaeota archaeon]